MLLSENTMETPNHTEPRKPLLEYGVFWPDIYTNFVIDFVKPGNENDLMTRKNFY